MEILRSRIASVPRLLAYIVLVLILLSRVFFLSYALIKGLVARYSPGPLEDQ